MKHRRTVQGLALSILLLVAASALAADKGNATKMTVLDPVMVNGTTLAPGDYKVTWDGSGADVQVTILQGKKVVATVPAKLEPRDVAYGNTAIVTQHDGNGLDLVEIRPQGRKEALALGGAQSAKVQQ